MNVSELYKQVAQLGFEDSLEDSNRFIYAANRAILQVCRVKPAIRTYLLNHRPLPNGITKNTLIPIEKNGEDLTFEATSAKAYYFEADGNGVVYIEVLDNATDTWSIIQNITLASNGEFVAYKGFIQNAGEFIEGQIRIRFTGEYFYSVRNVALYDALKSNISTDISNYGAFSKYDIKTLVSDFLEFDSPPVYTANDEIVLNQLYKLEGDSVVLLPYKNKGVYKISYKHLPTLISLEDDATKSNIKIDLDEELCSLLPTLVAAYVWADDEPEKSEYYLNLYRERAAIIENKAKKHSPVKIRNVYGW